MSEGHDNVYKLGTEPNQLSVFNSLKKKALFYIIEEEKKSDHKSWNTLHSIHQLVLSKPVAKSTCVLRIKRGKCF